MKSIISAVMPAPSQTKMPDELEREIAIRMARGELSVRRGVDFAEQHGFHVSRECIRAAFKRHKAEAYQATGVSDITRLPANRQAIPMPVVPTLPAPNDYKREEDRIDNMVEILRGILKKELTEAQNYSRRGDRTMTFAMYRNAKATIRDIVRACTDKAHLRQINFTFIKNEGGLNLQAEESYKRGFDDGFKEGMDTGVQQFRDFIKKEEDNAAANGNGKQAG